MQALFDAADGRVEQIWPAHDNAIAARLQRAGIDSFAGRNGTRLALAADLPGMHITTALRWTTWAKRDWMQFVAAWRPISQETEPQWLMRQK